MGREVRQAEDAVVRRRGRWCARAVSRAARQQVGNDVTPLGQPQTFLVVPLER